MIRVVFDTVVFVRSLINPRSIAERLVFLHSHRYQLFLSKPVLLEILEVLRRPELTRKFHTLHGMDMRAILGILAQAQVVDIAEIPPVSRDEKDDKFLATAAAADANFLVSDDQDLLVLGEYHGVRIVDTLRFLSLLEQHGRPIPPPEDLHA